MSTFSEESTNKRRPAAVAVHLQQSQQEEQYGGIPGNQDQQQRREIPQQNQDTMFYQTTHPDASSQPRYYSSDIPTEQQKAGTYMGSSDLEVLQRRDLQMRHDGDFQHHQNTISQPIAYQNPSHQRSHQPPNISAPDFGPPPGFRRNNLPSQYGDLQVPLKSTILQQNPLRRPSHQPPNISTPDFGPPPGFHRNVPPRQYGDLQQNPLRRPSHQPPSITAADSRPTPAFQPLNLPAQNPEFSHDRSPSLQLNSYQIPSHQCSPSISAAADLRPPLPSFQARQNAEFQYHQAPSPQMNFPQPRSPYQPPPPSFQAGSFIQVPVPTFEPINHPRQNTHFTKSTSLQPQNRPPKVPTPGNFQQPPNYSQLVNPLIQRRKSTQQLPNRERKHYNSPYIPSSPQPQSKTPSQAPSFQPINSNPHPRPSSPAGYLSPFPPLRQQDPKSQETLTHLQSITASHTPTVPLSPPPIANYTCDGLLHLSSLTTVLLVPLKAHLSTTHFSTIIETARLLTKIQNSIMDGTWSFQSSGDDGGNVLAVIIWAWTSISEELQNPITSGGGASDEKTEKRIEEYVERVVVIMRRAREEVDKEMKRCGVVIS